MERLSSHGLPRLSWIDTLYSSMSIRSSFYIPLFIPLYLFFSLFCFALLFCLTQLKELLTLISRNTGLMGSKCVGIYMCVCPCPFECIFFFYILPVFTVISVISFLTMCRRSLNVWLDYFACF